MTFDHFGLTAESSKRSSLISLSVSVAPKRDSASSSSLPNCSRQSKQNITSCCSAVIKARCKNKVASVKTGSCSRLSYVSVEAQFECSVTGVCHKHKRVVPGLFVLMVQNVTFFFFLQTTDCSRVTELTVTDSETEAEQPCPISGEFAALAASCCQRTLVEMNVASCGCFRVLTYKCFFSLPAPFFPFSSAPP